MTPDLLLASDKRLSEIGSSGTSPDLYVEERHRELLLVLDRLATAFEESNRLTNTVAQAT